METEKKSTNDEVRWEHRFGRVEQDQVIEDSEGSEVLMGREAVGVDEYIDLMAQRGYEFCGSFPHRGGITLVMKRIAQTAPELFLTEDEAEI